MTMQEIIKKTFKDKTGISIYTNRDFFNGYITKITDDFVFMTAFVYDEDKSQYVYTTKLKVATRRITEVYVGVDNDDLPALGNYSYPDFQHFYYDQEGLYFAETNRQPLNLKISP